MVFLSPIGVFRLNLKKKGLRISIGNSIYRKKINKIFEKSYLSSETAKVEFWKLHVISASGVDLTLQGNLTAPPTVDTKFSRCPNVDEISAKKKKKKKKIPVKTEHNRRTVSSGRKIF